MGGCVMDLAGRPAIESMEQMFGYFSGELIQEFPKSRKRLMDQPDDLVDLEREVYAACVRGADMITIPQGCKIGPWRSRQIGFRREEVALDSAY